MSSLVQLRSTRNSAPGPLSGGAAALVHSRADADARAQSVDGVRAPSPGLALVDRAARPLRYLRVSLTDRCNYRCTYCMPDRPVAYGPRSELLRLEEVVLVVSRFVRAGVQRVRLTGGEPTLRRGLVELVAELTRLPTATGRLEVVMTTNGERLEQLARPLAAAGLHSVTISLDSLRADRFAAITRRGDLGRVQAGIGAAVAAGFASVKLNTVAVRGFNDDELGDIAVWAWERGIVPRAIELMPMAQGELFVPGTLMPAQAMRDAIAAALGTTLAPVHEAGARPVAGPATYWAPTSGRWADHRFGTIGAMTENFCATCNRVRLSATGQLHGCLAYDAAGDLRSALRDGGGDALDGVVRHVLGTKGDGHGFHTDGTGGPRKSMISIGG